MNGLSSMPDVAWATRRVRDLVLLRIDADTELCIACDSSGAYGEKPEDVRYAPGADVGYAVSKVPLMEVLAAGAVPRVLVDVLSVEMDPFGRAILSGVRRACEETGYDIEITGSDETNFPTVMTGVGTTVIATLTGRDNRLGSTRPGDEVFSIGMPLGGPDPTGEYDKATEDVASIGTVRDLLSIEGVREILPVGSRGIAYETRQLAATAGLSIAWDANCTVDLTRSAGASTSVICSVDPGHVDQLRAALPRAQHIGTLTAHETPRP